MSESVPFEGNSLSRFRRGFTIQRRVLIALLIRQLMTKYGRNNIGFLWIVLEPMILCCGVLIVRSMISASEENGVSLIAMLVTGYLPLTLWRHLTTGGVAMLRRSANLLYHRDISLFDCCYATVANEIGGCSVAAILVYWGLYTTNLIQAPYDVGLLLCGWFMMGFLSFSVMMFFAVMTEYYEWSEKFIQPIQYLMLPLCGFFFMVNWLPTYAQKMAWFVPQVHCFEMIRAGMFGPGVPTFYTPWYTILFSFGMLAFALPMVDKARDKIHFG